MSKRKRDPTFVASEKMALIDIVERHFEIVECKKSDAVSMVSKNEEWRKIALEFNAMSSIHPREWTVLKNCWENLKKRAKSQHTQRNQHYIGTGGGPPKKIAEEPAIERVLVLIQSRVTGFINNFDSDNTCVIASGECSNDGTQSQDNTADIIIFSDPDADIHTEIPDANDTPSILQLQTENETATNLPLDWSMHTPSMLRGTRNPLLVPSPSPSPDVQPQRQVAQSTITMSSQQEYNHTDTPSRVQTASTSRRRPTIRSEKTQSLTQERLNIMLKANTQAEEEHDIQMRILQLKEEQEKQILEGEKLKVLQESIKLEILKIQLKTLQE